MSLSEVVKVFPEVFQFTLSEETDSICNVTIKHTGVSNRSIIFRVSIYIMHRSDFLIISVASQLTFSTLFPLTTSR
jgi:hypothetical protein